MNHPTAVPGTPEPGNWPAGWYLDHRRPGHVRYYDGQQMTDQSRPLPEDSWHYVDPAGWTFHGGRLQAAENVDDGDDSILDHLLSPVGLVGLLLAAGAIAAATAWG